MVAWSECQTIPRSFAAAGGGHPVWAKPGIRGGVVPAKNLLTKNPAKNEKF